MRDQRSEVTRTGDRRQETESPVGAAISREMNEFSNSLVDDLNDFNGFNDFYDFPNSLIL